MKTVGFCWCDMCGFSAKVIADALPSEEAQVECPDCKSEMMLSFLCFATELPEHVIEDDPMDTFTL